MIRYTSFHISSFIDHSPLLTPPLVLLLLCHYLFFFIFLFLFIFLLLLSHFSTCCLNYWSLEVNVCVCVCVFDCGVVLLCTHACVYVGVGYISASMVLCIFETSCLRV